VSAKTIWIMLDNVVTPWSKGVAWRAALTPDEELDKISSASGSWLYLCFLIHIGKEKQEQFTQLRRVVVFAQSCALRSW
jgi:hypothetical protein